MPPFEVYFPIMAIFAILSIPVILSIYDTEWGKRLELGVLEEMLGLSILLCTATIWFPPVGIYYLIRTFKNLVVNLALVMKRPPNLELTLNKANETLEETNRLLERISS